MGASGSSASLTLGNITTKTLSSESNATLSIVNSGTSLNNIWNMEFELPRGSDGSDGKTEVMELTVEMKRHQQLHLGQ